MALVGDTGHRASSVLLCTKFEVRRSSRSTFIRMETLTFDLLTLKLVRVIVHCPDLHGFVFILLVSLSPLRRRAYDLWFVLLI